MKKALVMTVLLVVTGCMVSVYAEVPALKMVKIPGLNIEMTATEITQKQYVSVMGENPSWFQRDNKDLRDYQSEALDAVKDTGNLPVECVSIFDIICFCNTLSRMSGYTPVYAVNGETDVAKWDYTPHQDNFFTYNITVDETADGYRLPDGGEWNFAARGGSYAEIQYLDRTTYREQAWFDGDWGAVHEVATKKPNGYGLYDMLGNVSELYWQELREGYDIYTDGGNFYNELYEGQLIHSLYSRLGAWERASYIGFRVVRNCK